MTENKGLRLLKVAKELNVGISTIVDYLHSEHITIESNPNTKISEEVYGMLLKAFQNEKNVKKEAERFHVKQKETLEQIKPLEEPKEKLEQEIIIKDLSSGFSSPEKSKKTSKKIKEPKPETEAKTENVIEELKTENKQEFNIKVLGKIDLETLSPKKKSKNKETPPEEQPSIEESIQEPQQAPTVNETTQIPENIPSIDQTIEELTHNNEKDITTKETEIFKTEVKQLEGPTILGKIELPSKQPQKKLIVKKEETNDQTSDIKSKKKRKRIQKDFEKPINIEKTIERNKEEDVFSSGKKKILHKNKFSKPEKVEPNEEEIQKQIKETLARLSANKSKSKAAKYRREKREAINQQLQEEIERQEIEKSILKVTEFVTANELAVMMNVPVNKVIQACMSLGLFVSINQRLDAETIAIVAEEFGYKTEFVSVEVQEAIQEEDAPQDLQPRPPIVTVMGHVDHGKTSLLDYIRKTNVIAGEAGGITQHIGAYSVKLDSGKTITFLDTPGHEAFTAMRARGAKVTDIAIIVIAADDSVMPQTVEAINHAQAAGVPMVFAINKIDKPGANSDKIREQLANMNILVEDWGGKYQVQEISAKKGLNIDLLLEKVLLEAELLELKANPKRLAKGTIIESSLDKGRGYVSTLLVQNGTLRVGDVILAGCFSGRIKAMYNERGNSLKEAGPSTPVLVLGLNGAPQAGDLFNVLTDEKEAKEIAAKRLQLQREQGLRTKKHITLEELGRRIAIGDFKELNIIVKGDVDGSVEALSDSLLKLSTEKIQVNIIHKSVGQISESDVLLASASNAIIVGFQVRPSNTARKLAEAEQIDIRSYSIIYNAIEEIKAAMEGMLAPEIEEKVTCNLEVRETFKITKVGTIAGCMVLDGKITRNTKVRVIRDGIVIYTGELGSLKRFKDDVKEVSAGYECGLNIANYNDIKVGDIIEGFEEVEVKQKL